MRGFHGASADGQRGDVIARMTVTPETALKDAVSLLSDHHISGLPVVDQKRTSDR